MKILVTAEAFGYGPIITATSVISHFRDVAPQFEINFMGSGIALEQAIASNLFDHYFTCHTHDFDELEKNNGELMNHDLLISSENLNGALYWLSNIKKPIYYIDNLMWMWDEIPEALTKVNKYFISEIFDCKNNYEKIGTKINKPCFVGPLRNLNVKTDSVVNNQLMINLGGADSFMISTELSIKFYQKLITKILSVNNNFEKIIICGGSKVINALKQLQTDRIEVAVLENSIYLKALANSSHCILAPGLANFIESIGCNKNLLFLPPLNYSQFLQLEHYRKMNLGLDLINWDDFEFYKPILEYLPEEEGVNAVLWHVQKYIETEENIIVKAVSNFFENNQALSFPKRNEYLTSLPKDGIQQIVTEILIDIQTR